jgi:hypothetical protein
MRRETNHPIGSKEEFPSQKAAFVLPWSNRSREFRSALK